MVRIKVGVQPHNLYILAACANVAKDLPYDTTITSGTDGSHMVGSKHYTGDALDIRSSTFPNQAELLAFTHNLQLHLGWEYQIIVEADHIHVEYDPHTPVSPTVKA